MMTKPETLTPAQLAKLDSQYRALVGAYGPKMAMSIPIGELVALLDHIRAQDARIASLEGVLRESVENIERAFLSSSTKRIFDYMDRARTTARAVLDGAPPAAPGPRDADPSSEP